MEGCEARRGTQFLSTENHQWYRGSLCPRGETGQIPVRKGPVECWWVTGEQGEQ